MTVATGCIVDRQPDGFTVPITELYGRRYQMSDIRHRIGIAAPKERVYETLTVPARESSMLQP